MQLGVFPPGFQVFTLGFIRHGGVLLRKYFSNIKICLKKHLTNILFYDINIRVV